MAHEPTHYEMYGSNETCSHCKTPRVRGECTRPDCPAFLVTSGGGYTPPTVSYVQGTQCWAVRRYGVIWACLIGVVVISVLALLCCCFILPIKSFIFSAYYGIFVQSVVVAPQGFYVPNDQRLYDNSTFLNVTMGNVTLSAPPAYNTSLALENVCAIPIRSLHWTNDWYLVANETAAWNQTSGEVNESPEIQGFFAPDVLGVLPEGLWQMGKLPNLGKAFESGEPLDHLQTVCIERMVVELWAAMQEMKARLDACACVP